MSYDEGSFRDPAGKIFYKFNRVFRHIFQSGEKRVNFIINKNILNQSVKKQFLIPTKLLSQKEKKILNLNRKSIILEHDKIPYISYPYEWSFYQLKEAALHHLNFHIFLLSKGATLIDASAYNIQFIGTKPTFIDILSIREYEDGEFWLGHKQFCENFLNPLLLTSVKSVRFNNWFKGNLEGIHTEDLNSILNIFDKFSYNIFVHVYLLSNFEKKYKLQNKNLDFSILKKLPKSGLINILQQLKKFIQNLEPKKNITVWQNYSFINTYSNQEIKTKAKIVKEFILNNRDQIIIDLGCNDGYYSKIAIKNGAKYVLGFDYDINSIDRAFLKNKNQEKFLPLLFDATNPSSNIGWNEFERKSFNYRSKFHGLLALAFIHHLVIAKNIPLKAAIDWLINLAPKGLIEFIPKNDFTVQKMIRFKGDIFPTYNEENFKKFILRKASIISIKKVTNSGRKIYEYQRKNI